MMLNLKGLSRKRDCRLHGSPGRPVMPVQLGGRQILGCSALGRENGPQEVHGLSDLETHGSTA